MDWTNKNIHPSKAVQLGDEVEIMVLEIDEGRRRLSLGMKQCKPNPWEDFATQNKKDDKITGDIKSITDFGIFIGLEGGIDGLIHLSDISWTEPSEEAVKKYKKGDSIESLIISIDVEKERISLGVKQLTEDPNPSSQTEDKIESKPKDEKKVAKPKPSAKKESAPKDIENAGTTSLGALLKAKLDDGK
jgi:small subunit ribosomal protein S1